MRDRSVISTGIEEGEGDEDFERSGELFIITGLNKCTVPSPKAMHKYQPTHKLRYALPCKTMNARYEVSSFDSIDRHSFALSAYAALGRYTRW
jgi:hypothetical protein